MEKWRRQTFIVAICFALVLAARIYVRHVLPAPEKAETGDASLDSGAERGGPTHDAVVTLDANP